MNNIGAVVNILEMFCCLAINTVPIKALDKEIEEKGFFWLVPPINKSVLNRQADFTQTVF